MRRIGLIVLAFVCLRAETARAQQAYAAALLQYMTGDAAAAVAKVQVLEYGEIVAGLEAFNTTRNRQVLTGAAALHTEAAFRRRTDRSLDLTHLSIATAIVEFGEAGKLKTNSSLSIAPAHASPVSAKFRRFWYATVVTTLVDGGRLQLAEKYLDHALTLFPQDADIQLLAGIGQEMLGAPRTSGLSDGDQRKAREKAEKFYRTAVAESPTLEEARLRLGHVLQERKALAEARRMLTPLVDSSDVRIAYLSALFLGGVEDADRHPDVAVALYDKAAARIPFAQTARLAASELRHRAGDRRAAADAIPAAAGDGNTFDPWWTYLFGEYWRADMLLDALREMRRA